ncbi:MAG TPA: pyridoxine 5'-phosphate synthase [Kiritimatiellia bacterium]|nr:pyridoxine 5'-phosphate synthase [Kiritimatiellia bacterium]HRZ11194.1 pyridoxine 5'-phosphate synthase [Kiritimatiellia bacterium]HSA19045.1 pyridoxine 5'-phosphate synthase [Kiritimatiellia bacterium]
MSAAVPFRPLRLGVNLDHVATLRQVRGTEYPDVLDAARLCLGAGAHGITVHLREDRRHIQDADVFRLKAELDAPLNLEMANAPGIVQVALQVRPAEVCLVPERRQELTTEGGLDVARQETALRPTIEALSDAGIEVSLFIEADARQLEAAARLGAPVVELHTGAYCDAAGEREAAAELKRLIEGARRAHALGLQVNAGHGLNTDNLPPVLRVPHLDTLNIGHSLVARSVFVGLDSAVREMLDAMALYEGGEP